MEKQNFNILKTLNQKAENLDINSDNICSIKINAKEYEFLNISQKQFIQIQEINCIYQYYQFLNSLNTKKHLLLMQQLIKEKNVLQQLNKVQKSAHIFLMKIIQNFIEQQLVLEKYKQLLNNFRDFYKVDVGKNYNIFQNFIKCFQKNNRKNLHANNNLKLQKQKFCIINLLKKQSKKKKKKKKKSNSNESQKIEQKIQKSNQDEFFQACKDGFLSKVDHFIQDDSFDINQKDVQGWTGFMYACQKGDANLVKYMTLKKVDVYLRNDDGNTGLMLAAINGHSEVVDTLIKNHVNLNQCNNQGETAFTLACKHRRIKIVDLLVQQISKMPTRRTRNKNGYEALTNREQKALMEMVKNNKQKDLNQQQIIDTIFIQF